MFRPAFATRQHGVQRTRQARHIAAALVIGLAVALMGAACVAGSPASTTPTPQAGCDGHYHGIASL